MNKIPIPDAGCRQVGPHQDLRGDFAPTNSSPWSGMG